MGRRRSLVGALFTELERSARRAAAESRRTNQRVQGVRLRALEREMVRDERAAERARIQNEREAERAAALHSRERSRRLKLQEKEDQLREWKLEVEDYVAKDEASLRVANEGPEVEDREALFAELQRPRPYDAPDFVPSSLASGVVEEIRLRHHEEAYRQAATFHQPGSTLNAVQFVFAGLGVVGGAATVLPRAPSIVAFAGALGIGVWSLLEAVRRSRWDSARAKYVAEVDAEAQKRIAAELASRHAEALGAARVAHEAACAAEEAGHLQEQAKRLAHVQALLKGDEETIKKELAEVFPLELIPELKTSATVRSERCLQLFLQGKLAEALQPKAGTLLSSGKPSFKMKTQKLLRAEAQRYLAGLALRHASEAMLFLPSIDEVEVEIALVALDAARGVEAAQSVLTAKYSFGTLAPLQMEDIDPVEALTHFEHKWELAPVEAEVKRMVGK